MTDDKLRAALEQAEGHQPVGVQLHDGTYDEDDQQCGVCAEDWPCLVSRLAAALVASAPDEGRDVERLEDAFSRAGALLHEEVWHIRTDELPAILAALAASAPDEGLLRDVLPILDTMIERQTLTGAESVREIVRAALAASAPDEGPLPAGHPDTWPGGTMHMPARPRAGREGPDR